MDECLLCQKLKLKPNPAKFNEILRFPTQSETAKRWLNFLMANCVDLDPTHAEISICELHFNPSEIIRRTKSGEHLQNCFLTPDAVPIYFTVSKILDQDLITKWGTIKERFKEFLNLHVWKYAVKGNTLKFMSKCGHGCVTLNGLKVSASVYNAPVDVSVYTKARTKIDQWSKLRGLMRSIEDQLLVQMKVEVIETVDLDAGILHSPVVETLGWNSCKIPRGIWLYKVKTEPEPSVVASIEITSKVKAHIRGKAIKFNEELSIEGLERFVKEIDEMCKKVDDSDSAGNVRHFLKSQGKICRICLHWSRDADDFVQLRREHLELIEESGDQFSMETCEKCHVGLENFLRLKENSQQSQEIFSQLESKFNEEQNADEENVEKVAELFKNEDSVEEQPSVGMKRKRQTCDKRGIKALRTCDICGHTTNYMDLMTSHIKAHHVTPTIECCGELWNHFRYNAHKRIVHSKDKVCDICGRRYGFFNDLRVHMKKVHGQKGEYVCDQCGQDFSLQAQLKKHLATEHGKNVSAFLMCDLCGKKYLQPSALAIHKKAAHSVGLRTRLLGGKNADPSADYIPVELPPAATQTKPDRAFKCHLCTSSYDTEAHLKRHHGRAHDPNPARFECAVCPKTFVTNYELNTHIRCCHSKRNWVHCPLCANKYTAKHVLKKHLLWGHTDSFYRCTCGKKTKQATTLKRHLKTKHNIDGTPKIYASMKIPDEVGIEEKLEIFNTMFE